MQANSVIEDDERRPLLSPNSSSATPGYSSPGVVMTKASSPSSADRVNDDDEESGTMSSSWSCRHCWSTYVPIEPLLFGYAFSRIVVIVLTGFYFYDQASQMYGDPSMNSLNPCGRHRSGSRADRERAENVQKESLQLTMIAAFTVYMTAVLPTLFLGPLIDRIGRRLGFVLPLLGVVARAIVFLFVLGTGASPYFVYIGTVLEGLGGGFGSFLMTTFSAAADITEPGHRRALRICIIEAVQVWGSALATFIAGQWRRISYTQPVMLAAVVGVVSLVYALWFMPETHTPSSSQGTTIPPPEEPAPGSAREDQEREEREPLLSEKTQRSRGRGRPDQQGRTGQDGREGRGYHAAGVVERIGINDDAPVRQDDLGSGRSGGNSVDGAEVGTGPHNNHAYISFSPTGHRLSHSARLHSSGSQRGFSCGDSTRGATISETPPAPSEPASHPPADSKTASYCSIAIDNIRKSWGVYFRKDDTTSHPARRCVLLLCFVCFLLTVAVNFSKPSVETVFRLGELCWNAVQESEFDSGWLVQHWIFILVCLYIFQKRLKMRNVSVAIVGCVSALCAPLIFSLATVPSFSERLANILVFVSAGSGTLARVLIPMLRSMSSAVVSLDEQGALFASYACVELAGAAVFDLAASQVYKATIHVWKGIIFVIMTFFFVVVLILLIVLSVVQRRAQRTEAHADRNPLQCQDTEDAE